MPVHSVDAVSDDYAIEVKKYAASFFRTYDVEFPVMVFSERYEEYSPWVSRSNHSLSYRQIRHIEDSVR